MSELYEKLQQLAAGEDYPFHMPGHKRNTEMFQMDNPYGLDITEIDGFDNLHQKKTVLKKLCERIASCFGAEHSWLLVNGSTSGILIGVSAVLSHGEEILIARNCHLAVYNAIFINELHPSYIYPQPLGNLGINGPISSTEVDKLLEENSKIRMVVVTSPTYEGVISDIHAIAEAAHRHGAVLMVDEAHGAHLGLHSAFYHNSIYEGADLVVQSIHKTLPAFTQTAVLHMQGNRVSRERLQKLSAVFQTSSPSYLLLSAAEKCVDFIQASSEVFSNYERRLSDFYKKCRTLQHIVVYGYDFGEQKRGCTEKVPYWKDPSKIIISASLCGISGQELYDILRQKYHLQMEAASRDYVIAMTSVCDRDEGFERLWKAIAELDRENREGGVKLTGDFLMETVLPKPPMWYTPYEAEYEPGEWVERESSLHRISKNYIYLYPPGTPLLTPGEMITQEFLDLTEEYIRAGLKLYGGDGPEFCKLEVVENKAEEQ